MKSRSWWQRLRCALGFHTGPFGEVNWEEVDYFHDVPMEHCEGCGRDFEL